MWVRVSCIFFFCQQGFDFFLFFLREHVAHSLLSLITVKGSAKTLSGLVGGSPWTRRVQVGIELSY